jgi:prepilin peptidase CpaA
MPLPTVLDLVLLALVSAAAVHDLRARRIPNRLLLLALAVAVPLQAAGGGAALLSGLAGAGCGLALFLPLYLLRGMAAGDVKLLATVGAFAGPAATCRIALLAWCVGGLMALALIVARGQVGAALANLRALLRPLWLRLAGLPALPAPLARPSVGGLPYGVAVALATIGVLWVRHA